MKRLSTILGGLLLLALAAGCAVPTAPPATTPTPTVPAEIPSATPPSAQPPHVDAAALAQAIAEKDIDRLRAMMGSSFMMAFWRSEGNTLSPDQAAQELRDVHLSAGSNPLVDINQDPAALLDGVSPFNFLPPGVEGLQAVVVRGLGATAGDEGIAYIVREDGQPRFYGMLIALGGFDPLSASLGDLNTVGEMLAQAVQARNFEAMRVLMKPRFSIATFDQTLFEYTSEEALEQLRQSAFADGSVPQVRFDVDVPALLGGRDPLGEWGPVAQPVRAVYISGLGADAQGEGVLVIARDEAGQFYWHGLLLPAGGKFPG